MNPSKKQSGFFRSLTRFCTSKRQGYGLELRTAKIVEVLSGLRKLGACQSSTEASRFQQIPTTLSERQGEHTIGLFGALSDLVADSAGQDLQSGPGGVGPAHLVEAPPWS